MNLRDLEYLIALAQAKSFRQAAAACEVSQPTLSTQIKKLEAELGVTLFDRSIAPLTPTPAGARIIERARAVLRGIDEIRAEAALSGVAEAGNLRIGLFPTLAPYLLPHIVGVVSAAFPDIKLLLSEDKSSALLDAVEDGALDAALLALPVDGEGLVVRPLFGEELVLAVPAGSELAGEGPLAPASMAGAELTCLAEGHCLGDQVGEWIAAQGGRRRRDFAATSLEAMRAMISAGTASTLLPALAVVPPVAERPGMVVRRFEAPQPSRTIALVFRASSPRAALLDRLAPLLVPRDVAGGLVSPLVAPEPQARTA